MEKKGGLYVRVDLARFTYARDEVFAVSSGGQVVCKNDLS